MSGTSRVERILPLDAVAPTAVPKVGQMVRVTVYNVEHTVLRFRLDDFPGVYGARAVAHGIKSPLTKIGATSRCKVIRLVSNDDGTTTANLADGSWDHSHTNGMSNTRRRLIDKLASRGIERGAPHHDYEEKRDGSTSSYISLRQHTVARISAVDFNAVRMFEAAHPEMYSAPKQDKTTVNDMDTQMAAFNAVFAGPHGDELKSTVEWVRNMMEHEDAQAAEVSPAYDQKKGDIRSAM